MMFLFNSVFFRFLLISLGPGCKNIHNYDKLGAALAFLQSPQGSKKSSIRHKCQGAALDDPQFNRMELERERAELIECYTP